jgi:o-succinylbenzoate---CoA ligase
MTDWVREHAAVAPGAVAVSTGERALTYAELDAAADDAVAHLEARGIAAGATMAFAAPPLPETLIEMVAGARLGATLAPYGPMPPLPGTSGPPGSFAVVTTAGSTGDPKGVILTPGNVTSAIAASQARLGNDDADRWLLCLPLYHIAGLSVVWRSFAAGGSVLVHDRFDPSAAAEALRDAAASMVSLVPTMLHRILEIHPGPYRGVRGVLLGGGPASPRLVEAGLDAGLPVLTTYGTTESASQIATVAPGEERDALGTVGRPIDGMEVSFEDGEILVDGPAVAPGYVGEPVRTGPHRTRDHGHFDEEGRLVVTGRVDDIILTGGEKVAPQLVEAVLESFPSIERAVVVGVPDPDWGQAVVAVVEGDPLDETALGVRARAALAVHQVPKRWVRVESLPELPGGKVDRRAVMELLDGS